MSLLNETTLKAIEIEDGYIGVDPNDPNNAPMIRYSEKIEDINYNLHFLVHLYYLNLLINQKTFRRLLSIHDHKFYLYHNLYFLIILLKVQ